MLFQHMVTLSFWHLKSTAGFLPNWSILALMPYGAILNMNLWMRSVTIFRHDCYKVWYLYHIGNHPLWLEPVSETIFISFISYMHPKPSFIPVPLFTPVPFQKFPIHNPTLPCPFPTCPGVGREEKESETDDGGGGGDGSAARPPRPTVQLSAPLHIAVHFSWQPPYRIIYVWKINLMIYCKFPSQNRWGKIHNNSIQCLTQMPVYYFRKYIDYGM